jgi:L-amino acid N-acyltransferase YncA
MNVDPPVPPSQIKMRITNDMGESELPNGAEIHMIDGDRTVIIPSEIDPRRIAGSSRARGGTLKSSMVEYPSPVRPSPKTLLKTFIYSQARVLREMSTDQTGIKARLEAAKAATMAEFSARQFAALHGGRNTASPEVLEMARCRPDDESGNRLTSGSQSSRKIEVKVDNMETYFPYLHLVTEGEPNADVAALEPPKQKAKAPTPKGENVKQGPTKAVASGSKWIKDRDIKPLLNPDDTGSNAWASEEPKGFRSFSSNRADEDLGEGDDNVIEHNVKHQLADYTGNMAPAPVEWDSRAAYDNQSPGHAKWVDRWVEKDGCNTDGRAVDTDDAYFLDDELPAWIINDTTLEPPPVVEKSLRNTNDTLTMKRRNETAQQLIGNWNANTRKRISDEGAERSFLRKEYWRIHNEYVPGPNPHAPKTNIYLRPAHKGNPEEVEQIRGIYNYYVNNSCGVIATQEQTNGDISNQIDMTTDMDALPYIVAVLRVPGVKGQQDKEQVVGFAFANYLSIDRKDAYRYSVEFSLFVHPKHKRLGIGKCLMDMMLLVLDKFYLPRNGYTFQHDEAVEHRYMPGGSLFGIKKICLIMPFDANDTTEYDMVKSWVGREWGFEEEAILKNHGYKFKQPSKV